MGRLLLCGALLVIGCREQTPASSTVVRSDAPHVASFPAPSTTLEFTRLTSGGANESAVLPWIVAFHGLGDNPNGFRQLFEGLPFQAHVYLARGPITYGTGYDWFGERVTGEPERLALAIQRRLDDITQLLATLAAEPRNRGDAVVTGFSQGGVLSFAIAVAGLRHVRAALPLAGWLPPSLAASAPLVPVYAFHGEDDQVVPFVGARRMVGSWQNSSEVLEFRVFRGLAHRVSPAMHGEWAARLSELMHQPEGHERH